MRDGVTYAIFILLLLSLVAIVNLYLQRYRVETQHKLDIFVLQTDLDIAERSISVLLDDMDALAKENKSLVLTVDEHRKSLTRENINLEIEEVVELYMEDKGER